MSALESGVRQVQGRLLPVWFNHDPRVPPLGRTVSAEVVPLEDGQFGLLATSEIFEPGDELSTLSDQREMALQHFDAGSITVVFDRSYRSAEDAALLAEIESIPSIKVRPYEKKAVEPLSVLLVALAFGASAFVGGLLNKAGSDAWDWLKPRVALLLSRRRQTLPEFLLVFEVQLQRHSGPLSIQCILTSPSEADVDLFWSAGLLSLEDLLPSLASTGPDIRRIVLHFEAGALVPGFAVRRDCVPLQPRFTPPDPENGS